MSNTVNEILDFVKENDVKFVKLAFCDLFGIQKNISILSNQLEVAFSEGVLFDASSIKGFTDASNSDLLLFPDASTLTLLPWRPMQGKVIRFFCEIRKPDGSIYESDSRNILKNTIKQCNELGLNPKIGTECEFYLFKTDTEGNPTLVPHDEGSYLDINPMDKGENVRREICLYLEEMGFFPETSHHEQGPGQHEIDFLCSDAITAADHFLNFKSMVKAIASRNGLYASFMPKPIETESGNGVHVNLSLIKDGKNLFENIIEHPNELTSKFIAGVLKYIREISLFLNPIPNSYKRLGTFEAPAYISWSSQNRSQLIRIPTAKKNHARMEIRSPDACINPYLAFSLIISAGLRGIKDNEELPEPINCNLYTATTEILKTVEKLPETLGESIKAAKESSFIIDVLGKEITDKMIACKEEEHKKYLSALEDKENHHFMLSQYFQKL